MTAELSWKEYKKQKRNGWKIFQRAEIKKREKQIYKQLKKLTYEQIKV